MFHGGWPPLYAIQDGLACVATSGANTDWFYHHVMKRTQPYIAYISTRQPEGQESMPFSRTPLTTLYVGADAQP